MKIEMLNNKSDLQFKDLKVGDCFSTTGNPKWVYRKIHPCTSDCTRYVCMDMESCQFMTIDPNSQVVKRNFILKEVE